MKKFTLVFFVLSLFAVAQDAKPKPLTAEQTLALYKSQDHLVAALDKVKATKEYADYVKAMEEKQKAVDEALKGVDQKKWALGPYFEWIPAPAKP